MHPCFVTLLVITLLAFLAIAIFLPRRMASGPTNFKGDPVVRVGIPMTKEELELERQSNEEVFKKLEASIVKSGLFRAETIPALLAKLEAASVPFGRVNTKMAFDGDTVLTVEEKKALGLNTRMKYSKQFIEYFHPSALKTIEPKATLECLYLDAFHRVSRAKQLLSFKKLGFVKQLRIVPTGDGDDCTRIKRLKKTYSIEEVPELPLPGCKAPFCRCWYEPIIHNDV